MATGKRPDGIIFAAGAKEGEVLDFPSVPRGWGVTVDGQDPDGNSVTDPTNGIPPMEWVNALQKRIDENIWWLLQNALPDWLAGSWPKGAVVVNDDIVWRSQKDTTTEPTSTNGDWLALFPLQNLDGRYVPQTRKINGHALNTDTNVTAQDIFNGQVVDIGNAVDLNTITTPGLYRQAANAQAASGKNYPEANAGSLEVYKHAGITQVYRVYNNSRQYARTLYSGTWSAWGKGYDTNNKPAASDVDAVSATNGGTFQKEVGFNDGLWVRSKTGMYHGDDAAGYTSNNMLLKSWYGIGFYCTLTDADGKETGLTGYINTRSGRLEMKDLIIPGNYENFDARYYTRTLADQKFQPKGNYGKPSTHKISGNILWTQDEDTGVIEMSGKVNATSAGARITFPYAFTSKCYSINLNSVASTEAGTALAYYNDDTTGFNLHIGGGGTVPFAWTARGI